MANNIKPGSSISETYSNNSVSSGLSSPTKVSALSRRCSSTARMYTAESIRGYQESSKLSTYASLSAESKSVAKTSEDVSIKGSMAVPAASSYQEATGGVTELLASKSPLSKVPDIDVCSFLSKIPPININLNPEIGDSSLSDILGEISGITLEGMEVVSRGIVDAVSAVGNAVGGLASAIQESIPTIGCATPGPEVMVELPTIGSAITPKAVPATPTTQAVPRVPYASEPQITIDSPDVTVRSIDDELDGGEF